MPYLGRSVIAIVPARGGSKSIPGKNLAQLAGRSLLGRAADVCSACSWLDAAVLSTDDRKIAEAGRAAGLSVPFMRPDALATDTASSISMWQQAWRASEDHFGVRFDVSVLLEPTSPLRLPEDIAGAVRTLLETGAPSVVSVSPTPAHFSPQKTLKIGEDGDLRHYHVDGPKHARRQTIPAYFHRNGAVYAVRRETLIEQGQIMVSGTVPYVIERPMVNIDDPLELDFAGWLLTR